MRVVLAGNELPRYIYIYTFYHPTIYVMLKEREREGGGLCGRVGERDRDTERPRDRETEKQRDRETERQRDRIQPIPTHIPHNPDFFLLKLRRRR